MFEDLARFEQLAANVTVELFVSTVLVFHVFTLGIVCRASSGRRGQKSRKK